MPTRADLRQMAVEEATIIGAGETLTGDDFDYVERRIDSRLEYLATEGLTPFDIQGVIPQAYMLPLARVIAADLAPGHGMDVQKAAALGEAGMRELRRLKAKPYFGTPNKATYY